MRVYPYRGQAAMHQPVLWEWLLMVCDSEPVALVRPYRSLCGRSMDGHPGKEAGLRKNVEVTFVADPLMRHAMVPLQL